MDVFYAPFCEKLYLQNIHTHTYIYISRAYNKNISMSMYVYIVNNDDDDGDDDYDDDDEDEDEDDDDDDDNDDKTYIRTGKSLPYLSIPLIHFYIYHATSSPTTGPMIGLTSFQFH